MPVVVIPQCFLDLASASPDDAECRVASRTVSGLYEELFERFPALFLRFKDADGQPRTDWFGLYRERDGYYDGDFLEELPGFLLDDDDRIHLINQIGC